MEERSIRNAINSARKGIDQYLWLMRNVYRCNVRMDREFQRRYNGFYRVRQRSKDWYVTYFDLLEARKFEGANFAEVLDFLWDSLGRYEPSFSSKLVATIDPHKPVWDRFVLQNTGLQEPKYSDKFRKQKAKQVYRQIGVWYSDYLTTEKGHRVIEIFDESVPEHEEITDLKKVDFVLWQTRS